MGNGHIKERPELVYKRSVVTRIPVELEQRISSYGSILASNGIKMGRMDLMRNFAGEAITPRDSVKTFIGVMNEASKQKKK